MKTGPKPRPIIDRFMSHVTKDDGTGCWLWNGSRNWAGYGLFLVGSRTTGRRHNGAHRVSHELFNGPIPEGMDVCHRCDNPPCVNPAHLFVGTRRDNVLDMVTKGRARKPKRTVCKRGHPATPGEDCKECARLRSRRHYARNAESERERNRRIYWADPEKHREQSLARYHRSKQ